MVNKIKQFRYADDSRENLFNHSASPEQITAESLEDGTFLANADCSSIIKLGVQSLPGTKFYLNSSTDPIIIGITGIYELELEQAEINAIRFDSTSIEVIKNNTDAYLLIDVLYKEA